MNYLKAERLGSCERANQFIQKDIQLLIGSILQPVEVGNTIPLIPTIYANPFLTNFSPSASIFTGRSGAPMTYSIEEQPRINILSAVSTICAVGCSPRTISTASVSPFSSTIISTASSATFNRHELLSVLQSRASTTDKFSYLASQLGFGSFR